MGACYPEDIKKIEERNNGFGSIQSIDTNRFIHKNNGINGVLEQGKSIITYQRRKRRKRTDVSDMPKSYLEIIEEAASSSLCLPRREGCTSVELEVTANKSLEEDLDNNGTFSDNDRKHRTDQRDNDELPRVASDITELSSPAFNDATTINKSSCDADIIAIDILKEHCNEAGENVGSEEENNGLKVVNESINVATAGYTGKKLLVLDVNGLLVDINSYVPYDYDPDDIILKKAVFKRPYCDDFLRFCFEKFNVGVWSSRTKRNMEPILDFLFGKDKCKLLFCWDQSHCTQTGFNTVEKRYKPLLLKKLKKLWDKCDPDLPWERGLYNESNTLLLDDTPYKALTNPRYTAIFPYTYQFRKMGDNSLGPSGDLRIYLEGLAMAENVQEYVKQNPFGQRPITETNLSWRYYLKVIEASSTPPRPDEDDSSQ